MRRIILRNCYTKAMTLLWPLYLMTCVQLTQAEPLVVLTEAFYPMSYIVEVDGETEIKGFATELVRAVLAEADVEYTLALVPWARAIHTINHQGDTLVFSMARTTDREEKYYWIGEVWPLRHYLYGLRKYKSKLPTSLEDAKEFRIGVHRGDVVYEYLLGKGFDNLKEVKDVEKNLFLLHRDRLDLVPFVDFALGITAIRKGYKVEDLVPMIDIRDIASVMSIALSKNTDPLLATKLVRAYKLIRETGRYDEIMAPLRKMIEGKSENDL